MKFYVCPVCKRTVSKDSGTVPLSAHTYWDAAENRQKHCPGAGMMPQVQDYGAIQ
jgi:hypothetical protein